MNEIKPENFDPQEIYKLISKTLSDWFTSAISQFPNFVLAIVIVLVFYWLAKTARRLIDKWVNRATDNPSLTKILSSLTYLTIFAVGAFTALSVLHLDRAVTSLLAGAGVIGLALGIAFQDIAANFMVGTYMTFNKPFVAGDLLETEGFFGVVRIIHLRTTEIVTMQGQVVKIPNAAVFKGPIINYTALGRRRIDVAVGVHYSTNLPFAKKVAREAVEQIEGIEDEVTVFYESFGDSSINFNLRFWIPFTNKHSEFLDKQDQAIIAIKKAFDENNITIPFPIRTLEIGDVNFKQVAADLQKSSEK